jgi:molecular chaperone DnaJ
MGFGGFDFSDLFTRGARGREQSGADEQPGGGFNFGDIFSQFFRGDNKQGTRAPEKGADLEYALSIDFWQAIKGTQVRLNVNRQDACGTCNGTGTAGGATGTCPECNGTGNVNQMAGSMRFTLTCPRCTGSGRLKNACPTCHGDGRISRTDTVEVRIPPGAQTGSRLRVAAKGNAGTLGAPPGDLYITVRVDPHPFFRREGDDIHIKVPVTVWEAALGTKIDVPTIDGRSQLKIPQGTSNGQKFRLREKGVFNSRKNARGDQIVEVQLTAPEARDERTREILRELARLHPEDPRRDVWSNLGNG